MRIYFVMLTILLALFGCDQNRIAPELSKAQQQDLAEFSQLVFDANAPRNGAPGEKWMQKEITYAVMHVENEEYLSDIHSLFSEMEKLTGIKFEYNGNPSGYDWNATQIIIQNIDDWASVDETLGFEVRLFYGIISQSKLKNQISLREMDTPIDRCVSLIHATANNETGEVYKNKVMLVVGWDDFNSYGNAQKECLYYNFLSFFGFAGGATRFPSITNPATRLQGLSEQDRMAIRVLYSPNVTSGAPKHQMLLQARDALLTLSK